METLYQVLGLIGAGIVLFILYRYIKSHPEQLSREYLAKSFGTMGMLGLILIAVVFLLVWIVRST